MTKEEVRQNDKDINYVRLFRRMFEKILEDAIEAYHRTPSHISSKPYIERILRLAQAGVTIAATATSSIGRQPSRRAETS